MKLAQAAEHVHTPSLFSRRPSDSSSASTISTKESSFGLSSGRSASIPFGKSSSIESLSSEHKPGDPLRRRARRKKSHARDTTAVQPSVVGGTRTSGQLLLQPGGTVADQGKLRGVKRTASRANREAPFQATDTADEGLRPLSRGTHSRGGALDAVARCQPVTPIALWQKDVF